MSTSSSRSARAAEIFRLRLFVAGDSARSGQAEANLRALGEEVLEGRYELEVVDIISDPDRAEEARILATPTVIKLSPPPRRRVTGDLSRREDVLRALLPDRPRESSRSVPEA